MNSIQKLNQKQLKLRDFISFRTDILKAKIHPKTIDNQPNFERVYCVGLPRSGTHSLVNMFKKNYKASHEPFTRHTIFHVVNWLNGKYSKKTMKAFLLWRDHNLSLYLEASHYLHHVTPLLVECFPRAQFVLTIREPLSWMNSEINKNHKPYSSGFKHWQMIQDVRYLKYRFNFTKYDQALRTISGSVPIASYLHYWRDHINLVLDSVPSERLLILKTHEISKEPERIADHLGITISTLNLSSSHSGHLQQRVCSLTDMVNQDYLHDSINNICGDLLTQLF